MPLWYQLCRSPLVVLHGTIGVFLFGYACRFKKGLSWRLPLSLCIALVPSYFAGHYLYTTGFNLEAILSQFLVMLINYLLVLGICCFCFNERIWAAIYLTNAGMTAQEMAGCVKTLVKMIPAMNTLANHDLGILLVDVLCFGGVFLALFLIFRPYTLARVLAVGTRRKAILSMAVLLFYMGTVWLTRDYVGGTISSYVPISSIFSILMQSMIFVVQFDAAERDHMMGEMDLLRELMHEQHSQYEASRDSVKLINEKYHDLSSLIGSIQNVVPGEELSRLKNSIARYDVQVHTGYEVLDVVLTEKMNLCLQRNITMTCNIGKADFGFMEGIDLYTLINNALNNAINAVSGLPEGRARYIMFTAAQENNMVSIHVENPCFEHLEFTDGLPRTKGDTNYHGFGMKSMLRTAEKYGGALSADLTDNCFRLDILLVNLKEQDVVQ